MGLKITQDTFNKAVQENIEDLGLEQSEAIEEAYKQFQMQGADLSMVSKNLSDIVDKTPQIVDLVTKIKNSNKTALSVVELLNQLKALSDESINCRVIAANNGAHNIVQEIITANLTNTENQEILIAALKTILSLTTKNPDIVTEINRQTIFTLLKEEDVVIRKLALKWARECCVMHENNRQQFMDQKIIELLKPLLEVDNVDIRRECMGLFRALVLDDDVRVEFGRAHEHARIIASESLCILTPMLGKGQGDDKLISDVLQTISALMVRSEFCKKVETAGGLEELKRVLSEYGKNEKIVRQCFKLIKALVGDDDVKTAVIQNAKMGPNIVDAINNHKNSIPTTVAGLSAIAALTLRSPANSNSIFDAGAAETIVRVMKMYQDSKEVQKAASWAIRNMVSRSQHQVSTFISLGVEEILQHDLKKFKENEYDFKAALRDLRCEVKLNEEWTGKGGALTTRKNLIEED